MSDHLWLVYNEWDECVHDDFNNSDYSGSYKYDRQFRPTALLDHEPKTVHQEKLEVPFDTKELTKVWVVIARYTDGGTFGCTSGYWKIVGVVKTDDEAYDIKKKIENKTWPKPKYKFGGREEEGMLEWEGYFASLDDVEVHRMEIDRK